MEKNKQSPFLMNAWYAAALSKEVGATEYFHRKILGISVLIYRKEDGTPVAIRNRCPHRFAPMHLGKRQGDNVTCLYHGLTFDCRGKCTHNPHGNGTIPKAAVIQSFPLVERDGFLWLWPGDPEMADTTQILDCSELSRRPSTAVGHAYMYSKCNYELMTDNIMDLSHVDHVHGPLINTAGKLSPLIPQVTENGDKVSIRWEWHAHPAMLLFAMNQKNPEGPSQQYVEVNWQAPASMNLNVGAVEGNDKNFKDGQNIIDFHTITPETETTSHYFFGSTRDYKVEDGEYNDIKLAGMIEAFTVEDLPLAEAQQIEMGTTELWGLNPVLLSSDAGNVRVRRRLQALIQAELQRQQQAAE